MVLGDNAGQRTYTRYLVVSGQPNEWVLDFDAPLGRDYRDHFMWRADLRMFDQNPERTGYFRWGDEPVGTTARPNRVFELDNLASIPVCATLHVPVGARGPAGESAAHRLLKEYVAAHTRSSSASAEMRFHGSSIGSPPATAWM